VKAIRWAAVAAVLLLGFSYVVPSAMAQETTAPNLSFALSGGEALARAVPARVVQGEIVRISAEILIESGTSLPPTVTVLVQWRRSDKSTSCGTQTIVLDTGGETGLVEIDTGNMDPAEYIVDVILDPDGRIEESDETDNAASVRFTVDAVLPEVHPVSLDYYPGSPVTQDDTVHLDVEIRNTGDAPSGEMQVRFALLPLSAMPLGALADLDCEGTSAATGINAPPAICSLTDWTVGKGFPLALEVRAVDPEGDEVDFHVLGLPESARWVETEDGAATLEWDAVSEEAMVEIYAYDADNPWASTTPLRLRVMLFRGGGLVAAETDATIWILDPYEVPASVWWEVASVPMPGLLAGGSARASTFLDTLDIRGHLASDGLGPSSGEETFRWFAPPAGASVTYAVRADVLSAGTGSAGEGLSREQDASNSGIVGALTVAESTRDRAEIHPIRVTFSRTLPLDYNRSVGVTVLAENTGSVPAEDVDVLFEYRFRGDSEWSTFGEVSNALRMSTEVDENRDSTTATFGPVCSTCEITRPGVYDLRITLDPPGRDGSTGEILETDESNNTLITSLTVEGAQLRVQGVDVSPAPVHRGETLTAMAEIENLGLETSPGFVIAFYVDEVRVDTAYYGQDVRNGEEVFIVGRVGTAGFLPGPHVLRVVVDPDNAIAELDESDNTLVYPFEIVVAGEPLAEIYPTGLRISPASPVGRDAVVECALTVRNVGEIDAGHLQVAFEESHRIEVENGMAWTPFTPVLDESGEPVTVELDGLPEDQTTVVVKRFPTEALMESTYRLRAIVDSADEIEELDERNNEMTVWFTIGEPDVGAVEGVNLLCRDASIVFTEGSGEVRGRILNNGTEAAGAFQVTHTVVNAAGFEVQRSVESYDGLGAWQWIDYVYRLEIGGLSQGTHYARTLVDSAEEVAESDEGDNVCAVAFRVDGTVQPGRPDLQPVSVRFSSPDAILGSGNSIEEGLRLYANTKIRNNSRASSGAFVITYIIDGVATEQIWANLGPFTETEIAFQVSTETPGIHTISSVIVDSSGGILETDESNNTLSGGFTYTVLPAPTMEVQRVLGGTGAATWLFEEPSSTRVVGVWSRGDVKVFDVEGQVACSQSLGGSPTVAAAGRSGSTVYVAVEDSLYAIDAIACAVLAPVDVGETILDVASGNSGVAYVATATEIRAYRWSGEAASQVAQVPVTAEIVDVGFDPIRNVLYAITVDGLVSFNGQTLTPLCSRAGSLFEGDPSALAIGDDRLFVGTSAGVVYAVSFCRASGGILVSSEFWRYPASGTLGSAIASIAQDPRVLDPVYVTTAAGELIALDDNGSDSLWPDPFTGAGPIATAPTVDRQSGRIALVTGGGSPRLYVLTLNGTSAFEVDMGSYTGGAPASSVLMIEDVERTAFGERNVRIYYFGAADGSVYKLVTQR